MAELFVLGVRQFLDAVALRQKFVEEGYEDVLVWLLAKDLFEAKVRKGVDVFFGEG